MYIKDLIVNNFYEYSLSDYSLVIDSKIIDNAKTLFIIFHNNAYLLKCYDIYENLIFSTKLEENSTWELNNRLLVIFI